MAFSALASALANHYQAPAQAGGPRGDRSFGSAPTAPAAPTYHPAGLTPFTPAAPTPAAPAPAPAAPAQTYAQQVAARIFPQEQQPAQQNSQPQWPTPQPFNPQPQAPAPAAPHPAAAPNPANAGTMNVGGIQVPHVTETTTLSAPEQAILNQQQALTLQTGALGSQLEKNIPTTPMSFANAPALGTPGQDNTQAQNAVYQQQTAMLDPQWAEQQRQLTDQLSMQGIPQGSAAYTQAMGDFQRQKDLAYNQARDSAIQEGYNVGAQTYGEQLAGRQQGVGEASQLYNQPANTLSQLLAGYNGQPTVPQGNPAPSNVAPSDVTGAFGLQQQGNQANYNAQLQQNSANLGGVSSLAGLAAMLAFA